MKINRNFIVLLLLLSLAACQQSNQELYEEVMDIHDEVMPRMDDLYKAKTARKKQLETPGLSEAKKEELSRDIARIDAASEGMMRWMRQFNPIADSAGEEKARAYLESELVKVKKVRADILEALKNAE